MGRKAGLQSCALMYLFELLKVSHPVLARFNCLDFNAAVMPEHKGKRAEASQQRSDIIRESSMAVFAPPSFLCQLLRFTFVCNLVQLKQHQTSPKLATNTKQQEKWA